MKHQIAILTVLAVLAACNSSRPAATQPKQTVNQSWSFDSREATERDWVYFHQDTATVTQWSVDNGMLHLTTRANTFDRSKMHTSERRHADGIYRWRTFIPQLEPGEQVSIGSWIYHDDHHELDFEVGSGKLSLRDEIAVDPTQLLACMTSQDYPFVSRYTPIAPGWHDFEIDLIVSDTHNSGNYTAVWLIDGVECQRVDLQYGPEIGFTIECSVENLKFIGDFPALTDHTAMFDNVSFSGHLTE